MGLSTQIYNEREPVVFPARPMRCGAMIDFADPDLEMVAIRVAARHSVMSGSGPCRIVAQLIDHLNSDTASVATLKTPTSAVQDLQ